MNAQSHRLIFSPTRGCLMAVAETSHSGGKSSATGATSTRTQRMRCYAEVQASNRPVAPVFIAQAAIKSIAQRSTNRTQTRFEQSGLTLSLSNPVVSAAQTVQKMAAATENTKSARMKALAAASAALAARGAVQDLGKVMNGQTSGAKDIEINLR